MRITRIQSLPLLHDSANQPMTFFVVRVETDTGLVGWGEACDSFGISHPRVLAAIVDESFAPGLLGHEVRSVEEALGPIVASTRRSLGAYSGAAQARSALDIALHDLLGQRDGISLSHRAGRVRDSIRVYVGSSPFLETGPAGYHYDLLAPALERGVTMVKMRIGLDWERALRVLTDLRGLLGDDVEVATDGSEFFDAATSARIARRLGELGVSWFEEPIEHTATSAIADLVQHSPVPIAYGEHLFGPEFGLETLRATRIGVVQPDSSIAGGFGPARALAGLAADDHRRVAIHHHAGPISMAANLHLAGSVAAADVLEYPIHLSRLFEHLAPGCGFTLADIRSGELAIPDGPGLGVALDEAALLAGTMG